MLKLKTMFFYTTSSFLKNWTMLRHILKLNNGFFTFTSLVYFKIGAQWYTLQTASIEIWWVLSANKTDHVLLQRHLAAALRMVCARELCACACL